MKGIEWNHWRKINHDNVTTEQKSINHLGTNKRVAVEGLQYSWSIYYCKCFKKSNTCIHKCHGLKDWVE